MKSFSLGCLTGLTLLTILFSGTDEQKFIPLYPTFYFLEKIDGPRLYEKRRDPCPNTLNFFNHD
jgi:hypothetical protein